MIRLQSRPRLRKGVRLTYDRVRDSHVLLYPEGVLIPNATAAAVLGYCDGGATIAEITTALGERYQGVRAEDVLTVLERFAQRRVVELDGEE